MKQQSIIGNLKGIKTYLSPIVFYYLLLCFVLLFLLAFWVPGNNYDVMASYIARIKLEDFGSLYDNATIELMFIFPKFFDYLHRPFLEWGYFTVFPSFALFTVFLYILIRKFTPPVAAISLFLIFICQPLIIGATAQKTDLPLALFTFLAWYMIFYLPDSPAYPALCILPLCALVGTKWHGFLLAGVLFTVLIYQVIKRRLFSYSMMLFMVLFIPIYWYFSSADVYIQNLWRFGTLFPSPDYLSYSRSGYLYNIYSFFATTLQETLELPLYFLDTQLGGVLWSGMTRLPGIHKGWSYTILPNSELSVFGAPLLVVIGACVLSLRRRDLPFSIRASAATALIYLVGTLAVCQYSSIWNRYFLPTYVMGILPLAYQIKDIRWHRLARLALVSYLFVSSAHALLLNQEKRLISFPVYSPTSDQFIDYPSIFPDFFDRDALYFHVWSGHLDVYDYQREHILLSDSLLFINRADPETPPFLYPFIKDRHPANTRLINDRSDNLLAPEAAGDFKYLMVYKGSYEDARFEMVYQYGGGFQMEIYKRVFQ